MRETPEKGKQGFGVRKSMALEGGGTGGGRRRQNGVSVAKIGSVAFLLIGGGSRRRQNGLLQQLSPPPINLGLTVVSH